MKLEPTMTAYAVAVAAADLAALADYESDRRRQLGLAGELAALAGVGRVSFRHDTPAIHFAIAVAHDTPDKHAAVLEVIGRHLDRARRMAPPRPPQRILAASAETGRPDPGEITDAAPRRYRR